MISNLIFGTHFGGRSNGRFITQDRFEGVKEDPPSLHKYTYAKNNPVNIIDPSGKFGIAVAANNFSVAGILATFPTLNLGATAYAAVQDPNQIQTLKLNLVYEKKGNVFYSDADKAQIDSSYVQKARDAFANIDIRFNITSTDGAGEDIFNSNRRITTGFLPGAINALFTKRGDPGTFGFTSSPEVTNARTGSIFIGTTGEGRDPINLAHGTVHALGVANGLNGYTLATAETETRRVISALILGRQDYSPTATDKIFYNLRLWGAKYGTATGPRPR